MASARLSSSYYPDLTIQISLSRSTIQILTCMDGDFLSSLLVRSTALSSMDGRRTAETDIESSLCACHGMEVWGEGVVAWVAVEEVGYSAV